jgi:hypothetical protein
MALLNLEMNALKFLILLIRNIQQSRPNRISKIPK